MHDPKNLKNKVDWESAKAINTDAYGGSAIAAAAHAMVLLDEGKTPEEAEQEGFNGKQLTGFLAGEAASIICHVHERGDEFRAYWNQKWGAPANTKGVVNPAILEVKTGT